MTDRNAFTRRSFLTGLTASGSILVPAAATAQTPLSGMVLRGSLNAESNGLIPGASDDQSRALNKLIAKSAADNQPLFIPPGTYRVSNLDLPNNTRLEGVPGATRLVYTGDGHMLFARDGGRVSLDGLVIDGGNRWLGDYTQSLVHLAGVDRLTIENCEIFGSRKSAISTERCSGRITRNRISGAANFALYAVESNRLSVTDNHVVDCGNGGILIHRWQMADDGSRVSGNHIQRIGALGGGTGQNGNGINIFRAGNVTVTDNLVTDCAFSAIRSNSGTNLLVSGNQCHRSGETAIYSEFEFSGAVISNNLVDGAANGISIANFNNGGRLATVANNVLRHITTEGPYPAEGPGFGFGIAAEADTAITGNSIDTVAKWGMLIGWGPYLRGVSVTGNMLRNTGTGIAVSVVDGAKDTLISDNIFQNALKGAIIGHQWRDAVTRDMALAGADRFGHLTVARNLVS